MLKTSTLSTTDLFAPVSFGGGGGGGSGGGKSGPTCTASDPNGVTGGEYSIGGKAGAPKGGKPSNGNALGNGSSKPGMRF